MRICPDCQTEIADGKSFCPNCGKFLPLSAAEKPSASPEPAEKPVSGLFDWESIPEYQPPETEKDIFPKSEPTVRNENAPEAAVSSVYAEPPVLPAPPTPSVWSFVFTFFLCSVPVIGIFYFLGLLFGKTKYPAKKNFARASLLFAFLLAVLVSAAVLIGLTFFREYILEYADSLTFLPF